MRDVLNNWINYISGIERTLPNPAERGDGCKARPTETEKRLGARAAQQ
jgi:hypothetical protein